MTLAVIMKLKIESMMIFKHNRWGILSVHEEKTAFFVLVGCHIDALPYGSIGKALSVRLLTVPTNELEKRDMTLKTGFLYS